MYIVLSALMPNYNIIQFFSRGSLHAQIVRAGCHENLKKLKQKKNKKITLMALM